MNVVIRRFTLTLTANSDDTRPAWQQLALQLGDVKSDLEYFHRCDIEDATSPTRIRWHLAEDHGTTAEPTP